MGSFAIRESQYTWFSHLLNTPGGDTSRLGGARDVDAPSAGGPPACGQLARSTLPLDAVPPLLELLPLLAAAVRNRDVGILHRRSGFRCSRSSSLWSRRSHAPRRLTAAQPPRKVD
jgi:hypothetical protein